MNSTVKQLLREFTYSASYRVLNQIQRFRNIHKGESCYIVGDGVSLKSMSLKRLSDKPAIACNYLPFHKDFDLLNCSYCVACAPYFLSPIGGYEASYKKHQQIMAKLYRELMEENLDKNYFIHMTNYPFTSGDNLFYMFKDIPDDLLPSEFISKRIDCFSGVIRTSILMAIYMGFDHCYLAGFDYTHVPSRSLHWYEKGHGIFTPHEDYNKIYFNIAKEFIDITTITLDGTSDFINAVTYKDHTGCDLVFRENSELLDDRYMQALASWSGYSIY